jgi:hypothetical protein
VTALFCRHNRFTADCPICSKGTVLDSEGTAATKRPASRKPSGGSKSQPNRGRTGASPRPGYPYVACGPYAYESERQYEVRLERVPGGLRLGEWTEGSLEQRAPRLHTGDVASLIASASERSLLGESQARKLTAALNTQASSQSDGPGYGSSSGRAGELSDELRIEALDRSEGMVRVARWVLRPGQGWLFTDSPTLFAPERYAEALESAVSRGIIAPA